MVSWEKRDTFVGKFSLLGMNDHLWGPSVHVDKSFTKIQAKVRPPPPSRQCLYLGGSGPATPPLPKLHLAEQQHIIEAHIRAVPSMRQFYARKVIIGNFQLKIREHMDNFSLYPPYLSWRLVLRQPSHQRGRWSRLRLATAWPLIGQAVYQSASSQVCITIKIIISSTSAP